MFIRTADDEYRELFGRKVYKVSLRLSDKTTCPNRDGLLGNRGCAFCTGSGEFAEPYAPLDEQLKSAIRRIESKLPPDGDPCRYIAYFQDHTNTYAPLSLLTDRLTEALSHPLVCGLALGTRPDCLPDDIVRLLAELNRKKPVWAELGLQTANDLTANAFGRGYPTCVYGERAEVLRSCGIRVVTHLILGLPGETQSDMISSVRYVNGKTDGVKFHMLHVLRGTRYEELFRAGLLPTYSLPEYASDLSACIRALDPAVSVHRMTGDGKKADLFAPKWSGNKKHVLNELWRRFRSEDVRQGSDMGG